MPERDDGRAVADATILRVRAGVTDVPVEDRLAVEAPLEIRLDGRAVTVLMRTPGHDEELVRGFLYSENLIARLDDIVGLSRPAGLTGDELGNVIAVQLAPGVRPAVAERLFYASSGCGVCGKLSIASLTVRAPAVPGDLRVTRAVIQALPERLRAAQPTFSETGGLHAAARFDAVGTLLALREDVGRHNALDKLIGRGLADGTLPFTACVLAVSGRVSYDVMQKAILAGVPVVVAVGAPSSLAVDLAEQFDVTLCGFVKDTGFNIYAGAERIASA